MTIGNSLRVMAVLGAAVAGAASATSQSNCPPGKLCGPQPEHVGAPVRAGHMRTDATIAGIEIDAQPAGFAGWQLGIKNDTGAQISIMWDESSFVMSNNQSAGRLIRGETRKMDSGKAQPPTPVPPGVSLSQYVIPEKLTSEDDYEEEVIERGRIGFNEAMIKGIEERRAIREKAINGGKLYLVIDVGGEKKTWTGVVETSLPPTDTATIRTARNTKPLYCAGTTCWFEKERCTSSPIGCTTRSSGACVQTKAGQMHCAPTVDECERQRQALYADTGETVSDCVIYEQK